MKGLSFVKLLVVLFLAESLAPETRDFLEFVRNIEKRIAVERIYEIETEQQLTLAPGEAVRLNLKDNPAGVSEFVFFYNRGVVRMLWRYSDSPPKKYKMTRSTPEKPKDFRTIKAEQAQTHLKVFTEWKAQKKHALVKFRTELPSEKELQDVREKEIRNEEIRKETESVRSWDFAERLAPYEILMDDPDNPSMVRLRKKYGLEGLVRYAKDDYEKLKLILAWVQKRWKHNINDAPSMFDPLTILHEAARGKRFQCLEYAVVLVGCTRTLGMSSRRLALIRPDAETAKERAGHAAVEVWLEQFHKWVLVDAQCGAIPEMNGVPLNAVELQDAIVRQTPGLRIHFVNKGNEKNYIKWIIKYLYYIDFDLDQRFYAKSDLGRKYVSAPGSLMLVPKGAKKLQVTSGAIPLKNYIYTSNPKNFYPHIKPGKRLSWNNRDRVESLSGPARREDIMLAFGRLRDYVLITL